MYFAWNSQYCCRMISVESYVQKWSVIFSCVAYRFVFTWKRDCIQLGLLHKLQNALSLPVNPVKVIHHRIWFCLFRLNCLLIGMLLILCFDVDNFIDVLHFQKLMVIYLQWGFPPPPVCYIQWCYLVRLHQLGRTCWKFGDLQNLLVKNCWSVMLKWNWSSSKQLWWKR